MGDLNETGFRLGVELLDTSVHTADDMPAHMIMAAFAAFTDREGDGINIITSSGAMSWPWEEIRGVSAQRMVALNELDAKPKLLRVVLEDCPPDPAWMGPPGTVVIPGRENHPMTPFDAREMAAKLIRAAHAAEQAWHFDGQS